MADLYNRKKVAVNKASVGDDTVTTFTYTGFSSDSKDTGYKLYDMDLVKQDLLNHFYIRKGEKLENPDFGTIIWDVIFEPFTEDLKEKIAKDVEAILNYDPRISAQSVAIDSTDQGIRIEAAIVYIPFNVTERMKFNFDKNTATIQ